MKQRSTHKNGSKVLAMVLMIAMFLTMMPAGALADTEEVLDDSSLTVDNISTENEKDNTDFDVEEEVVKYVLEEPEEEMMNQQELNSEESEDEEKEEPSDDEGITENGESAGQGGEETAKDRITFTLANDDFWGSWHDVIITQSGEAKTVWCLQKGKAEPDLEGVNDTVTEYVEGIFETNQEFVLNSDLLPVLERLMAAGYPYNTQGFLDGLLSYEQIGCTQEAVWILMQEGTYVAGYYSEEQAVAIEKLLQYATNSGIQQVVPSSYEVKFVGNDLNVWDGKLIWNADRNVWTGGPFQIAGPENYVLTYQLSSSVEGMKFFDKSGELEQEITSVKQNQEFYLELEQNQAFTGTITARATAVYPTGITWYSPTNSTNNKQYQALLGAGIKSETLEGSLNISGTLDKSEETTPDNSGTTGDETNTPPADTPGNDRNDNARPSVPSGNETTDVDESADLEETKIPAGDAPAVDAWMEQDAPESEMQELEEPKVPMSEVVFAEPDKETAGVYELQDSDAPATGDAANVTLWVMLLLTAMAGLFYVIRRNESK